ncbi:low molecular weight protein-tyrosine-phosphatase [Bacteroides propionicifaciens]|jgi:protein-tyrosine phosphatase|uniref:low molecular weight protein-tyrosine-phosphatase n=1 Tax=Bacteroides propionicifaciens TaxID=392838 RepID=UPI00037B4A9B|nr:low molecular weight protein-tyrosine-phosphatase [Bacteroides propionicifaciens]
MKKEDKKKILFVCLGNICRSPSAEGIMLDLLQKKGLTDQFIIDSAGTNGYHNGDLPDPRMRKHAAMRGFDLVHRSRQVKTEDFYDFDMIIGMDDGNISKLQELSPSTEETKKIHKMVDFLVKKEATYIPDPYYGGADGFELVMDLLEDACEGLIAHVAQEKE